MFLKNFHIFIKKQAVLQLQQKFTVQVTTLADCDDITRFDGTGIIFYFTSWIHKNTRLASSFLPFPNRKLTTVIRTKSSRTILVDVS